MFGLYEKIGSAKTLSFISVTNKTDDQNPMNVIYLAECKIKTPDARIVIESAEFRLPKCLCYHTNEYDFNKACVIKKLKEQIREKYPKK
jgi:hypothetical protein